MPKPIEGGTAHSPLNTSKGTPGDAKCLTEILWWGGEGKIRKFHRRDIIYPFENKQIKPIIQSNINGADDYV